MLSKQCTLTDWRCMNLWWLSTYTISAWTISANSYNLCAITVCKIIWPTSCGMIFCYLMASMYLLITRSSPDQPKKKKHFHEEHVNHLVCFTQICLKPAFNVQMFISLSVAVYLWLAIVKISHKSEKHRGLTRKEQQTIHLQPICAQLPLTRYVPSN